ncbi:MarR family winged helix-turn-helix transcriptional regulator [Spirillospora sp. NBC_01491]|uniref:MarR family winged helix-turn-helix transcriptional regulator n=1 Tax=Spirillospora sp. NBC_01491 TaxID=2976007 RepID=UPI002E34B16B|nr:MarR family winged helix-turn-helix transcriptional regulator [Spirillospora sp. NBC_01491]
MTVTDGAGALIEPRLAGHTGYLVRLAFLRLNEADLAALPAGRSPRDLAILGVLADRPLSQAALGQLLEVNRTVMISVIDGLEGAELVRRERDAADRRRYALAVTAGGRAALSSMRASVEAAETALAAPLGAGGRDRLNALLGRIVPDVTAELPEAFAGWTGHLADRAAQRLRARREESLRGLGLEPRCVRMLMTLESAQPCTQERLAAGMGVTAPTIVQAIDDYHSAGLILRDRNPADRREHVLRLSPRGDDYLAQALAAEDGAQRDLAGGLGRAGTAELNALLTALIG